MSTPDPAHDDLVAELAGWPLFASLPPEQLAYLAAGSRRIRLRRGAFLFRRGSRADALFGVVDGMVQLSLSNAEGVVKVVEHLTAGQTLGEAVVFQHRTYPVDASALVDTEVVRIPTPLVDDLLDDPVFARTMLASMAVRLHTLVKDIEMYTLQTATQRVVAYLVGELAAGVTPLRGDDEPYVVLRPSKRAVAARLGITPETLSRATRELADRGLVRVAGRRVVIPRPRDLRAYHP